LKFLLPLMLPVLLFVTPALADDNIANCEIVVQQAIEVDIVQEGEGNDTNAKEGAKEDTDAKKGIKESAQIATFLPAADFIFSVFDAEEGHITEIDDKPIRAVMCVRPSVIPTEFDFKIIRTGIPFYLSPNFDANDSALLAINAIDSGFVYNYVGPDLSKDDTELLNLRMKLLNEQEEDKYED